MKNWFDTWFDTHYYHLLYKDRNTEEAEFFLSNILSYLKPEKEDKFLDIACGKGRHAIFINQMGYDVEGIDLSSKSIEFANNHSNKHLKFSKHDMRLPFKKSEFDVVLNIFTSFGYFEKDEDNYKAIQAMTDNLKKGGRLVLDFMNAKKIISCLVKNEKKKIEHITFNINRHVKDNHIIKKIQFIDSGKEYHFQEKVQTLMLADFIKLFEKSGLKILNLWGDYSLNDYNAVHSPRLIILAQK